MSTVRTYRDLDLYQSAIELALRGFAVTKDFPAEERYSLTGQIRRSSRSVCANLAEAWRKRRYAAAFVSTLNDSEAEAAETKVHAKMAYRVGYLTQGMFAELDDGYDKAMGQLVKMIEQPEKWLIKPSPNTP